MRVIKKKKKKKTLHSLQVVEDGAERERVVL